MAILQETMLYASELTWKGGGGTRSGGGASEGYLPNGQGHTGSLPVDARGNRRGEEWSHAGQSPSESPAGHVLAMTLHQAEGRNGPEVVLTREGAAITIHLRAAASLRPGDAVETQKWSARRLFPEQVVVHENADALQVAQEWRGGDVLWTDGSRLDSGGVGAACAWRAPRGWTGRRFHLGNNKGVCF